MRFHSRIFSVRPTYIVLERPLPWAIDTAWSPELHAKVPGIQNSGIESLTIEFRCGGCDKCGGAPVREVHEAHGRLLQLGGRQLQITSH